MTNGTAKKFRPRGFIFDMDGLLLDSEVLAIRALVSAGAELGHVMPLSFFHKMIGVPGDACRTMVRESYGSDFPIEELFHLQGVALRRSVDHGELELKSGALDLLNTLDAHGIPCALATSSSRDRADHHLEAVGVRHRFAHIVTRDDVTHGKPHPEPYATATRLLGIDPADVLALEDSYNGVLSAHAAHAKVIMVPDLLAPTPEVERIVYRVIPSLEKIFEVDLGWRTELIARK